MTCWVIKTLVNINEQYRSNDFPGRKVTDYGDVNVVKYSSTDPEIITYNGYQIKNSNVCGQVSHDVSEVTRKLNVIIVRK